MRAVLRLGLALAVGVVALTGAPTVAQQTAPATTNAPATDVVGPRELQNFSLDGTVTRPSDQTAVPAPAPRPARSQARTAPPAEAPATATADTTAPQRTVATSRQEPRSVASTQPAPKAQRVDAVPAIQDPTGSASAPVSSADASSPAVSPAPAANAGFAPEPDSAAAPLAPEHKILILPWLLAALALAGAGAFLFWRNRPRHAFAGVAGVDAFVAPTPQPAPRAPAPRAAPPQPAPPATPGFVSTRLRPWMEIGFNPLRCVIDNDKASIEFELELFNSGSAPARDVLVEASLFNAGPTQESEIGAFFEKPVGQGERIDAIPPLKRVLIKTQVAMPIDLVQAYEVGGRRVFVPLIGFNALYRWSSGEGQTSSGYLLGRDTKSDKLAPFRLDLGPRLFRGLAARVLPGAVRK